jgi:hypothetical protein
VSVVVARGKRTAVLMVAIVSSMIVLSVVLQNLIEVSHEQPPSGIPVQETSFAGLTNEVADPAVLPGGQIVSDDDGVRMTIEYGIEQPIVSLAEAEQIGLEFFSRFPYMADVTLEPDPVWNRLADEGYFTLRYNVGQYEFYSAVNAMTGRVIGVSPHWSVLMQYNTSVDDASALSSEEIEAKAYGFLERNNYTIMDNARLEGPILEADTILTSFPAFRVRFISVINGCRIRGNSLSMLLDIRYGEVIEFWYHWRNITHIPVANVANSLDAERAARFHLSNVLEATGFAATSSRLEFRCLKSWPYAVFHLCWVIEIAHERYVTVEVDAVVLEVLSVWQIVIWP